MFCKRFCEYHSRMRLTEVCMRVAEIETVLFDCGNFVENSKSPFRCKNRKGIAAAQELARAVYDCPLPKGWSSHPLAPQARGTLEQLFTSSGTREFSRCAFDDPPWRFPRTGNEPRLPFPQKKRLWREVRAQSGRFFFQYSLLLNFGDNDELLSAKTGIEESKGDRAPIVNGGM